MTSTPSERAPEAEIAERQADASPRLAPVVLACLFLAALSLLLPSSLGFDPMTWATWGREIAHLSLSTDGGAAWKPLPVLVDVVFAPLGSVETWVWLLVARAGGLLVVAMAYRLARRLAGRWAGGIAAAGMLLSSAFLEYLTPVGMSEPLLAGLVLLVVERHLDGKYAQAYGLIFVSLLLRPEVFPFFVGYSIFMWTRSRRSWPWIAILAALLPVLWLLPDYLSSGDWLRSSRRAQMPTQGGPLTSTLPALAVLESGFNAVVLPIVLGAGIAASFAVAGYIKRREERVVLALSLLCVGWLIEVAVITEARLGSGDERYLIVTVALGCVLAGVGWARFVRVGPPIVERRFESASGRTARVAVIAAVVVVSAPFVVQRLDELSTKIGEVPFWAHKSDELAALIDRAGGRDRVLACRPITADIYQMPLLAWKLGIHQSEIVIAIGPKGTPTSGRVVRAPRQGTVFRTRTTRGAPVLPARLGSADFQLVATTDQWQVLRTCSGL